MDDEYAGVTRSKLQLRSDAGVKKKKKKKRDKEKVNKVASAGAGAGAVGEQPREEKRTKAELAFLRMQEKMQKERILQKAEMTHKQRVEKFNQHLDSLTEHFDIPKVSWTK